jgi:hypothetical protein
MKWRPISSAPKIDHAHDAHEYTLRLLLAYPTSGGKMLVWQGYRYDGLWMTESANGYYAVKPTHWMPLPPPPEASNG